MSGLYNAHSDYFTYQQTCFPYSSEQTKTRCLIFFSFLFRWFSRFLFPLWVKKRKEKKTSKMAADRPKRPLSAYMLWLNENREAIKKENPGIKVTEIAKRGGELWRGLKDKTVSNFFFVSLFIVHSIFRFRSHALFGSKREEKNAVFCCSFRRLLWSP